VSNLLLTGNVSPLSVIAPHRQLYVAVQPVCTLGLAIKRGEDHQDER